MTAPSDSPTRLVLPSEFRARANVKDATDTKGLLHSTLLQVSAAFQEACGRRFDEVLETRFYTPFAVGDGGDLYSARELRLDADLRSVSAITNGDGSAIDLALVTLLPLNTPDKSSLQLSPYGTQFWTHAGVTNPVGSIHVTGLWGWGGRWVLVTTLASDLTEAAVTLTPTAALEAGMILKIGSEYLSVETAAPSTPYTASVERAVNGSVAVAHPAGTSLYRWQAAPVVQRCVIRLAQIAFEQDKAPLFQQIVVGDTTFPAAVDGFPKDVQLAIRSGHLQRPPRIQSV